MRFVFFIGILGVSVLYSCRGGSPEQTHTQGEERIAVDESLEQIVGAQLKVFNDSYPDARIDLDYRPEVVVLNNFLSDKVKMAVLPRKLNAAELKHFSNKGIAVRSTRFAVDGVALIVHESSPDTTLTVDELIAILQGKRKAARDFVFDNANSSTVSFLKRLAGISVLPAEGVYALKSNPEVIRYVVDHPGAVGIVGMNWIEQPDSASESLVARVNYVAIKNVFGKKGSDGFYTPSQTTLALGQYPLMRDLYIINCSGKAGAGSGFAAFVAGDRGQRLVLLSGLLPDRIPPREILIK